MEGEQRWRVSMRWGVWTVALNMRVIVTAYLPLLLTFAASEEDISSIISSAADLSSNVSNSPAF
jgi:hypothetical protein